MLLQSKTSFRGMQMISCHTCKYKTYSRKTKSGYECKLTASELPKEYQCNAHEYAKYKCEDCGRPANSDICDNCLERLR
jgi:DNA-directed RNA polymerase subunit RPC12/RpoP